MAATTLATNAHAGSRTRVTSMGGLYDAATLHAPCLDPESTSSMSGTCDLDRAKQHHG